MDTINLVKEAIQNKKQVVINYEANGQRLVLPAALYWHPTTGNLLVDGFQIEGFSVSGEIPAWKMFEVDKIIDINHTDNNFHGIIGYNPLSKRYSNSIAKL